MVHGLADGGVRRDPVEVAQLVERDLQDLAQVRRELLHRDPAGGRRSRRRAPPSSAGRRGRARAADPGRPATGRARARPTSGAALRALLEHARAAPRPRACAPSRLEAACSRVTAGFRSGPAATMRARELGPAHGIPPGALQAQRAAAPCLRRPRRRGSRALEAKRSRDSPRGASAIASSASRILMRSAPRNV